MPSNGLELRTTLKATQPLIQILHVNECQRTGLHLAVLLSAFLHLLPEQPRITLIFTWLWTLLNSLNPLDWYPGIIQDLLEGQVQNNHKAPACPIAIKRPLHQLSFFAHGCRPLQPHNIIQNGSSKSLPTWTLPHWDSPSRSAKWFLTPSSASPPDGEPC